VEKLALRWHAVPVISDMMLATGTAAYPCAPFNGWYMGTEIGSRNLGDEARYNQLPVIAEGLGLDTRQTRNLWRDHALLVLNEAVLHSFEADGVRLVDHHQATAEFEQFCQLEKQRGREVSADWSWIVPPMAGSSTPPFHRRFPLLPELPNLLLQVPPSETARGRALLAAAS
jgi:nitric-oxide synthase